MASKTVEEMQLALKAAKEQEALDKKKEKEAQEEAEEIQGLEDAISVYNKGLCLHLGHQCRYFYRETIIDKHRTTGKDLPRTFLIFFAANQLYPHFSEMQSKKSQAILRRLIEGEIPDYPARVYTNLGNTRNIPGPKNYNLIDLSGIMKPSGKKVFQPPIILQALLMSLSGSVRTWEQDHWELSKQENYDWLEKYFYGALCADIGNPFLSMPVIFGAGKVGKNAMWDVVIPGILGSHLCFTSTWSVLDGNFNAFKVGKVVVFIDEIPPRDSWDKLKNITGSPVQYVKEKYGPEFVIENTICNALGSNEPTYPLPVEEGKQMTRVSPIHVVKDNTFAENVVRLLSRATVEQKLHASGHNVTNLGEYELGDLYLKTYTDEWQSEAVLQEWLDYLDTKFGGVPYSLQPLRGKDWLDILASKPNPENEVVNYIKLQDPEYITINEAYEIYKVMTGDRSSQYQRQTNNLAAIIQPMLEEIGYQTRKQVRVSLAAAGGTQTQTTVYFKDGCSLKGLKQDYSKYIIEELSGTKQYRRLKSKEE
jgi:hypothetical protein